LVVKWSALAVAGSAPHILLRTVGIILGIIVSIVVIVGALVFGGVVIRARPAWRGLPSRHDDIAVGPDA
jgi:hypothetical protein